MHISLVHLILIYDLNRSHYQTLPLSLSFNASVNSVVFKADCNLLNSTLIQSSRFFNLTVCIECSFTPPKIIYAFNLTVGTSGTWGPRTSGSTSCFSNFAKSWELYLKTPTSSGLCSPLFPIRDVTCEDLHLWIRFRFLLGLLPSSLFPVGLTPLYLVYSFVYFHFHWMLSLVL